MLADLRLKLISLYLRRTPWERGRWRLLRRALPTASSILQNKGARIIRTRHGFRMRVELNEWLGRHVYVSGEYEPPTSQLMKTLLQPGQTMIDIGANVGYFTLLASRCVGEMGRVLAFEPVPRTRQNLLTNLQLNPSSNVTVHEVALCDRAGETTFYEGPTDHSGLSSLREMADASRSFQVKTARFDDVICSPPLQRGGQIDFPPLRRGGQGGVSAANTPPSPPFVRGGETRINLIKIDVEGAEYEVLEGMPDCLSRDRPDLIIEVTDEYLRSFNRSGSMLCKRLFDYGYRMFAVGHDGLVPMTNADADLPKQFNAFFTVRTELPTTVPIRSTWTG